MTGDNENVQSAKILWKKMESSNNEKWDLGLTRVGWVLATEIQGSLERDGFSQQKSRLCKKGMGFLLVAKTFME